jgi:predicted RNA-binding Zn ribbon-like protein
VVGSSLHGRLGVCSAERCDRVYVDTSRNGSRRFCSTACQNRVKAAAFRAKAG